MILLANQSLEERVRKVYDFVKEARTKLDVSAAVVRTVTRQLVGMPTIYQRNLLPVAMAISQQLTGTAEPISELPIEMWLQQQ